MREIRNFNGVEIFRPNQEHEDKIYSRIKEAVFREFHPGTYTNKADIVKIVNFKYGEYYKILEENFTKPAPLEFAAFLASEYELYGQVSDMHKRGQLSAEDDLFWMSYASHSRRGIKHLLELLFRSKMNDGKASRTPEEQEEAISMAFLAAEELVSLYIRSDGYRSFLDNVTLILDPSKHTYFHVIEDESARFDIRDSALNFHNYVPDPMILHDVKAQGEILDPSFVATLGVSYNDTIGTIGWLIETYSDGDRPEEIGHFRWQEAISALIAALNISEDQATLILEGFSLSHETMEGRELYKPKQEHRAFKRAFFRSLFNGEEFALFSPRMAKECLTSLVSEVPFRKIPKEWKSEEIDSSLDALSLKAGRWFEDVVVLNLRKLGIKGSHSVKSLNLGPSERLAIPQDVGEIDFLGFHEKQKLLVIIEVKQVGLATEPRTFLDDLSKFVSASNNYSKKFTKKYNWAIQNIEMVERHLAREFGLDARLDEAGYALITLYPSIATEKIHDFTCICITKFMNESIKSEFWPFSKAPLPGRSAGGDALPECNLAT